MKKKLILHDNAYPFSIKPCSMSYEDEDYEIIYNGTDFEVVPRSKTDNNVQTVYETMGQMGFDWSTEWDTDWLGDVVNDDSKETKCKHEWKATQLVFNTVYDCKKCGAKKEDNN